MLPVFISMTRNCNGFKVRITKYQLKKQIGLVLSQNRQYNFLGFDLNMSSGPKSYRDFPARVLQKIRFSFTTSILVKVTQIIWRSIWIQMDFDINSAYFTQMKMQPERRFCPFPLIPPPHATPSPHHRSSSPHLPAKTKYVTTGFRHSGLKLKTSWARNMFLLLLHNDNSENHHCQTTSVSFAWKYL